MPDEPQDDALARSNLLELAHLGRAAEELLHEPLIERWFADLNRALVAELRQGTREEAAHWHDMLDCVDRLRDVLDIYIRKGEMAAKRLRSTQPEATGFSRFNLTRRRA